MEKVSVDTVKPWISQRISEMLGFEDEVVIDFVFNMLDKERVRRIIGPCRFTFLLILFKTFKGGVNKA